MTQASRPTSRLRARLDRAALVSDAVRSGCGVVSSTVSARAIRSTSARPRRTATSTTCWATIRIGSSGRTQRGATMMRERLAMPRSRASMPTASGVTRVMVFPRRNRLAASVPNPRLVMSVSSSAK